MFPVYVFLAFVGINAFERGLMKYHDRRIAREREQMARERKSREYNPSPHSEFSDYSFGDYEPDFDCFAKEPLPEPGPRPTHPPRRQGQRVRFAPVERRERAHDERVYPPTNLISQKNDTSGNGKADTWNGTHWDDFIDDWCDAEPMVDPFGILPPVEKQSPLSYGQAPHVETSRTKTSRPERRMAFV
ncbi:hypothetical protein EV356DRAFT_514051 [Viridothelium virens]|uniref:Uncharacterized protein n=1 Tax=Viridothelium virens TaxID=1048519 RepID=A0A6A6HNU3_VIRVR|nr:hypothetical protein EV356DRAFT_514051 [Viridothelium virens]